ncbi:MAG: hypothetical protein ABIS67_15895 [Candidatus Eisenbacteria bacterium]
MIALLDNPIFRFSLSGTLILIYMLADQWVRRRRPRRARLKAPRWMHPLIFVSLTAYYALIGPTGGPLAGGLGNLAGVLLAVAAMTLRCAAPVRYPDLSARSLFYIALPIAVGVPWGLIALSLPACAASVYACQRAERLAAAGGGEPAIGQPRFRMVPGIW